MKESEIKRIVKETVKELLRSGALLSNNETAYREVSLILYSYYDNGATDQEITAILDNYKSDPYFKIIPLFFDFRYTIESIAQECSVEPSTITRNKKRLCLAIYKDLDNFTK